MAADVLGNLYSWSTTAGSNQPAGSTTISTNLDDNLREIQKVVRYTQSRDTIASASTCDLGSKEAMSLYITGTTTITSLGTVSEGIRKWVRFADALTLTHNSTSLKLPGGVSITTATDDRALFESQGGGNWVCLTYQKANGYAVNTSVAFTDGSAASPGGYFSSDTNNGLYRIGADNWALSVGGSKWVEFSPLGSYVSPPVYTFGTSLSLTSAPGGGGNAAGTVTIASGSGSSGGGGDINIRPGDANVTVAQLKARGGNSLANSLSGGALSLSGGDTTASPSNASGGALNLWGGGGVLSHGSLNYYGSINFGYHSRTSFENVGTTVFRLSGLNGLLEWNTAEGTAAGVPRPAITSGAGTGASIVGTHNAFSVTFGTSASTTVVLDLTTKNNAAPATYAPIPTLTFQSSTAAIVHRISALSATSLSVVFASAPASGDKLHVSLDWYY